MWGDYLLCQITSKPYADPDAVELQDMHFRQGSLQRTSYARPGKLFTAHDVLIVREVGVLKKNARRDIVDAIAVMLRKGL